MRAIVFLLFIVLVFFIIRFILNRLIQVRQQNRQAALDEIDATTQKDSESMVRCALCSVHLPQSDAYYDGKDTFCSEGHMQQFQLEKRTHSTED